MEQITIRNSAKAIILQKKRLLAIEMKDSIGPWYMLPGGGQHPNETLHNALRRECIEEINSEIKIGRLSFIREYISINHEFAGKGPECHQIEYMFLCELEEGSVVTKGICPDQGQIGIKWINIEEIENHRLYPLSLRGRLKEIARNKTGIEEDIYLGDIN